MGRPGDARKTETERGRAERASRMHLLDLKRAHGRPPADVRLASRDVVARIEPPESTSGCSSSFGWL